MKRILTAAIGIPLVIGITLYSPRWVFVLLAGLCAGFCFCELVRMGGARMGSRPGYWTVLTGAAVTVAFVGDAPWVLTILVAAFLFSGVMVMLESPMDSILPNISFTALGLVYCGLLMGFLIWLPSRGVIVLLATIWAGDSAAYYAGRLLGRHKLAPRVSPNKTIEGSIAGLLGSMVAGVGLGMWLLGEPGSYSTSYLAVGAVSAGIAGQVGDLVESALKRSAGVKDSSNLLPGHGGMLDRLDSLLFAAPVFYWFFHS